METERRTAAQSSISISRSLAAHGLGIGLRIDLHRRISTPGEEGTMRRITHLHRTLVVLAVGLLALAAPLVAYADGGGPSGG
jgi:hypothetical protein